MPPKRNNRRKGNKPLISGAAAAMADCVFPQSVMFNIVTRLPVKSVHRFKAVCKPWCKLFSTPKFMKTHHAQLSQIPEYQSVVIYSFGSEPGHIMSLYKTEPNEVSPINLDHPYPKHFYMMNFVGCVNGMLCLASPLAMGPLGHWIEFWNPALNMSRTLPIPDQLKVNEQALVSVGFGYDDESDDFKLVRIVHVPDRKRKQGKKAIAWVDVYSANSDSWRTINVAFQFSVAVTKNQAIVNGNPYWVAKLDDKDDEVLVMFDVRKMAFKVVVRLSNRNLRLPVGVPFVDWKGAIAALVSKKNKERALSLDVWVLDDVEKAWIKKRSFGPIELKVDRFLQCLKTGEILGVCNDGKLFVLDAAAADEEKNGGGGVVKKEIVIDEIDKSRFQIHGYTPSLAYFKGMEKVKSMPWGQDRGKRLEYFIRKSLENMKLAGMVTDVEKVRISFPEDGGDDEDFIYFR